MAAGSTKGTTTGLSQSKNQTVTLTGLSNATEYEVRVTYPSGRVGVWRVTTDGSGQVLCPPIPAYEQGLYTMTVNSLQTQAYSTTWVS